MRSPPVLIGALVACAVLCGCAASDRGPDASAVADHFYAALAAKDGAAACADLAPETKRKLEQQEGEPCARAILALGLARLGRPAETSVYVTSASVSHATGGRTFLDEFDDGWKVSAAGCQPAGPDLPYDCRLEG